MKSENLCLNFSGNGYNVTNKATVLNVKLTETSVMVKVDNFLRQERNYTQEHVALIEEIRSKRIT
ncbi:hypothetical protein Leryth_005816 [Lithospermum erythrorhizon]|nr:hypothetical protein Leryth_005816 [Lithospermum erythrorhizon]